MERDEGGLKDTFGWDYENRLVSLSKQSAEGSGAYTWVYDYRTRRVELGYGGISTKVSFSGGTSVREFENNIPSVDYGSIRPSRLILAAMFTGHVEWAPNSQNPSGFDEVKRVDTQHANPHTHVNKATGQKVLTPHTHDQTIPGGVRPSTPDELPR